MIQQHNPDNGDLLISILPMHAARIYSGQKIFELRKALPRDLPRRIFLYETEIGKITGHFIVEKIISAAPTTLWEVTGAQGTTKDRFFKYFFNKEIGHAFKIGQAIKYKNPLSLNLSSQESYPVPQNFVYLDRFPNLREALGKAALSESLLKHQRPFVLRPIDAKSRDKFIKLVDKHISGSYSETGARYARTLLKVHDRGEDTEGIFSLRKVILEVLLRGRFVGFCVLTEKVGGSIKTGPVIFDVKYRNRGFGQKLRGQLHAVLKSAGYRKVYCTVPSINDGAVGYLLASEYKIEAHLQRQYHNHHNEFVFGHPLVADRGAGKEYYRPNTPVTEIAYLEESSPQVVAFMQQEFCETYCKLPDDWAARQVETATKKTKSRFKPREIYVGEIRGNVAAVALCLPKRGGGTKILLATHTSHLDSLVEIISRVESDARRTKPSPRKLYSLVSIFDTAVQKAFFKSGFGSEGILDRPYRPSEDLVVLSKMLT